MQIKPTNRSRITSHRIRALDRRRHEWRLVLAGLASSVALFAAAACTVDDGGLESGPAAEASASLQTGGACTTTECLACENAYQQAFEAEFGQGGGGSGGGLAGPAIPAGPPLATDPITIELVDEPDVDDILDKCYKVGEAVYTDTFNCRDFSKWFLRCLTDAGVDGYGLDMYCKNCNDGTSKAHRVVVYEKDGKWCPGEPQRESGGEASDCCKSTKAAAESCALDRHCKGTFPTGSTTPPSYAGCEPSYSTTKTCEYCQKETCTAAERAKACELLDIEDPDQPKIDECAAKSTNAACTQCCIDNFPGGHHNDRCTGEANCASKP